MLFYKNEVLKNYLFKFLFICLSASIVFAYSGGTGDPNSPYQIASVSDWQQLMNTSADWNRNFILIADVNLYGIALTPVGDNNGISGTDFTGVFDGNSHIIRNVYINGSSYDSIGLFGSIDSHSRIMNLDIADVNITGSGFVGAVVGYNGGGYITNCYATGSVRGASDSSWIGGLAGCNSFSGIINNCYSTVAISGNFSIGGLVGGNIFGGIITNCYSTGSVTGDNTVGGLCGENDSSITGCYSTGSVSANYYAGGLVGNNGGNITNSYSTGIVSGSSYFGGLAGGNGGTISNCYSTGAVSGFEYVGGLVGYAISGSGITGCYSTADVNGNSRVGGLVGKAFTCNITDCYSTGTVRSSTSNFYSDGTGGLVGNGEYAVITGCYSTALVQGFNLVGGLVGKTNYSTIITNCYSTGVVTGIGNSSSIGGLVGDNSGSVANCYSTAAVNGDSSVGGLLGDSWGSITNCYSMGAVAGNNYVGGLIGTNSSNVANCYSMGAVTGDSYVGGLLGKNYGYIAGDFAYGRITNCYSTGIVSGTDLVGGLAGSASGPLECFVNNFWDVNSSQTTYGMGDIGPYPEGISGKSTAQMKTLSTFTSAGWDFSYTDGDPADWFIQTNEYPILVWQISPADIYTDGKNNFRDFAVLAQFWMRDDCRMYNNFCDWSDLNFDGSVDIDDLVILMNYWLQSGIYE